MVQNDRRFEVYWSCSVYRTSIEKAIWRTALASGAPLTDHLGYLVHLVDHTNLADYNLISSSKNNDLL